MCGGVCFEGCVCNLSPLSGGETLFQELFAIQQVAVARTGTRWRRAATWKLCYLQGVLTLVLNVLWRYHTILTPFRRHASNSQVPRSSPEPIHPGQQAPHDLRRHGRRRRHTISTARLQAPESHLWFTASKNYSAATVLNCSAILVNSYYIFIVRKPYAH